MSEQFVDLNFLMPECGISEQEEVARITSAALIMSIHQQGNHSILELLLLSAADRTPVEMIVALLRLQERGLIRLDGFSVYPTELNAVADAQLQVIVAAAEAKQAGGAK